VDLALRVEYNCTELGGVRRNMERTAIPVTGCEMHFLDNQFTDGDEVVGCTS
jgi:hypothetical protein